MIGMGDALAQVGFTATDLGFCLVDDEDWRASFARNDGWKVVLTSDRTSWPAISLEVVPSTQQVGFSVWLLMRLFQRELPNDRIVPSLENQLWFLRAYHASVFMTHPSWREQYNELSTGAISEGNVR